ncbi:HAD-IIA family hydrolase [Micrococcus yunnanensis]|uniref:HAD-IIA family hydrolase n=1 Tax=Micrococcus TaxID=1269 RepID=UPI0010721281|nr:HAD-IIA family hydrolase [Micrococcus yunnanensis]MBF0744142.1 HAD-IIA family hydrolase [Micrococcus yunnanensis]TFU55933.1 HAD-IIA family hydrolase [Micrococcus yunnanensis]
MSTTFFDGHDGLLCDLDGVVYAGGGAIAGAVETLSTLQERGVPVGFVTNNASRAPESVAEHLRTLGVPAQAGQVFGSAPAGVDLLEETLGRRTGRVLVVGSAYLRAVVEERGYEVVASAAQRPDAVIQGFDPGLGWADLAEAAYAVRAGATWVATNLDTSIPRAEGIAPGNGALVEAVGRATGTAPVAAGKPEPRLFRTAAEALGLARPLVVGDRLDTDIRGGNAAGFDTVLVLTGIDTSETAAAAPGPDRPTWVRAHLPALLAGGAEAFADPRRD